MISFISWYILITFLGWLAFPLTYRLFSALSDRGYTLARSFGLLTWGYVFWLFTSLGITRNDIGGLLLGMIILGGLSAWAYFGQRQKEDNDDFPLSSSIFTWVKTNLRLIIATEILFFVAFALMAFFRSANPEIVGTEKPMELMFINSIMKSPTFPPHDSWLSGYAISYYYFGYVMTSMLAIFTGVPGTIAFNLMIALIFGLSAIGAYGILYNLLKKGQTPTTNLAFLGSSLLAPLFLLLVSNVEGFLEVLHRRGFFWNINSGGVATSRFWTWLDMQELSHPPAQPLGWIPERFWWWWRASRVVQDYDLNGTFRETIDEFPFFSYLLGDLHPHVLATPFLLLAIAVAVNLYLGGWRGKTNLFFGQLHVNKAGFFVIALVLGGLAFLNTWDILVASALIVFSYALTRVGEEGWRWERIEDILLMGVPMTITAFVLYLPFYIGFDSQAGGIVPNFMYVTRGAHLWVMWGTLFVPLFLYLIYSWWMKIPARWGAGILIAFGILLVLIATMFALSLLALWLKPELVTLILDSQGRDVTAFVADSMTRRLLYIGGLLTLLALLIPSLSFIIGLGTQPRTDEPSLLPPQRTLGQDLVYYPSLFIFLLITLGVILILAPDFIYLRDQFGYRINTVFKFYYEAWILLSLATAYGTVVLLRNLRGAANNGFRVVIASALLIGLVYPAIGIVSKTNNFKPSAGYTLNDFNRVQRENPDEAAAILWLRTAPDGIIAEAQIITGSYTSYGRISAYTGLPTVLGWPGHESQWRDQSLQGSRLQDIATLYSTSDWVVAKSIIDRYDIRYIVVSNLERSTYRVNEGKFNRFLNLAFQQNSIIIYAVP